jgi:hypothetical protein
MGELSRVESTRSKQKPEKEKKKKKRNLADAMPDIPE